MKNKTIPILAVIFVVLLGAYLIFERPDSDIYQENAASSGLVFPDFSSGKVNTIEITGPRHNVTIKKVDNAWFVEDQGMFPADESAVDNVLQSVEAMDYSEIASESPDSHADLEVDDENGVKVNLLDAKGQPLATIITGKNGPTPTKCYIREDGSNKVTLQAGLNRYRFDRAPESWKDRNIISFNTGDIKALEISRIIEPSEVAGEGELLAVPSTQKLLFTREGDTWTMVEPESKPGKKTAIDSLVTMLANMRAANIPDQSVENTGLDAPQVAVAVTLDDGSIQVIRIGGENPQRKSEFFARNLDKPYIYSVSQYQVDRFKQSVEDLTMEPESEIQLPVDANGGVSIPIPPPPPPSE